MDASAAPPDPGLGPAGSPSRLWPRVGLALVLALAAALRLWRLDQNGFDNEYYAAAVRSMMGGCGTGIG